MVGDGSFEHNLDFLETNLPSLLPSSISPGQLHSFVSGVTWFCYNDCCSSLQRTLLLALRSSTHNIPPSKQLEEYQGVMF